MVKAKLGASLVVVTLAACLFGCPLLKKKPGDAGADDFFLDAATVTVTGTGAKNEKDVTRYEKEEKIADEAATIGKDGTEVKTYPQLGVVVAKLSKGTAVTKIAKYYSTGVLVTFDDPAGGGKLMGWLPPESLATAPTTTATVTATGTWKPPVVVKTDAGTTPIVDAGAPPVVVVDAGSAPQPGAAQLFTPLGADGKCPTGFAKAGAGCKRPCATDTNCPRNTFCVSKFCSSSK